MLTKADIDAFYTHVESLNLKFPVAELARATGQSKGTVSGYLTRKKEPSENFIKAVYAKFPKGATKDAVSSTNGSVPAGAMATLGSIAESNKVLASANKTLADAHYLLAKNNDELISMLKVTTDYVGRETLEAAGAKLLALQEFVIEQSLNKGKYRSEEEIRAALGIKTNEMLKKVSQKDTQTARGNSNTVA
jgi:hypothetical protein